MTFKNPFESLTRLELQYYNRYIPTAFDESLTILEKVNRVIEHLNKVVSLSNELADANVKYANDLLKAFETFKNDILDDILPESTANILLKWLDDGTLAQIIRDDVLGNKADKNENDRFHDNTHYIVYPSQEDAAHEIQTFYDLLPDRCTMKVAKGDYNLKNKIVFNRQINLDFDNVIFYNNATTFPVIKIGDDNTQTQNIFIQSLTVKQQTNWNDVSTGVELTNLYNSRAWVSVEGFLNGVIVNAFNRLGNAYNHYDFGRMVNNKKSLTLTSSKGAWVNENVFKGGRFGWTSENKPVMTPDHAHVFIDYDDYSQNNNRFIYMSFESGAAAGVEYAVYQKQGRMNVFFECRYEGAYKFNIGKNSTNTKVLGGFGLENVTFENKSSTTHITNNKYEEHFTLQGFKFGNGTSAANPALEVVGPTGVTGVSMNAIGEVNAKGRFSTAKNYLWNTGTGDLIQARGIYYGTGSPEGVVTANLGSIYFNNAGGITGVYFKRSQLNTDTGWVLLQQAYATPGAFRPKNVPAGTSFFDTTANKPLWFNGTVWVDASGITVHEE